MHELPKRREASAYELSDGALTALRAAVGDLEHDSVGGPALHDAVCALAREARARQLPPERLLVCFKAIWYAAEATHPPADREAQLRVYDQMVSLCIREYFA